jgi:hypothetical protein
MLQTYEAVLQPNGQLQFFDLPTGLAQVPRRVLVTFTEEAPEADTALCGATLSEPALAEDWLRDEEESLFQRAVGTLKPEPHGQVVDGVVALLRGLAEAGREGG